MPVARRGRRQRRQARVEFGARGDAFAGTHEEVRRRWPATRRDKCGEPSLRLELAEQRLGHLGEHALYHDDVVRALRLARTLERPLDDRGIGDAQFGAGRARRCGERRIGLTATTLSASRARTAVE